jgi:hypothetical protein
MASQATWARYCVPTALAYVLTDLGYGDISKEEAADLVRHHPSNKGKRGWCQTEAFFDVVHEYIPTVEVIDYPNWSWSPSITLARWLREDGRNAIVSAGHHAMVVKGGKVVEDNGHTPRRGRMKWAVILPRKEAA